MSNVFNWMINIGGAFVLLGVMLMPGGFIVSAGAKLALGIGGIALFSSPAGWGILIIGAGVTAASAYYGQNLAGKIWG